MEEGSKRALTPKQQRFIAEYPIDLNGTQAAIRAGYSEKTARSMACELLTKPYIRCAIAELVESFNVERVATLEECMEILSGFARGETEYEVIVLEGQGNGISKAKKVMKKPDAKERIEAIKQLIRRHEIGGVMEEGEQIVFRFERS